MKPKPRANGDNAPEKHRTLVDPCVKPKAASAAHLQPYQFQPGQSGNPKGRERGSRNKLGEQFLTDLYAFWETAGPTVIQAAAYDNPAAFVKVIAMILPQEVKLDLTLADMTDDQFDRELRGALAALKAAGFDLEGATRAEAALKPN
jgi:hypothetical protein